MANPAVWSHRPSMSSENQHGAAAQPRVHHRGLRYRGGDAPHRSRAARSSGRSKCLTSPNQVKMLFPAFPRNRPPPCAQTMIAEEEGRRRDRTTANVSTDPKLLDVAGALEALPRHQSNGEHVAEVVKSPGCLDLQTGPADSAIMAYFAQLGNAYRRASALLRKNRSSWPQEVQTALNSGPRFFVLVAPPQL